MFSSGITSRRAALVAAIRSSRAGGVLACALAVAAGAAAAWQTGLAVGRAATSATAAAAPEQGTWQRIDRAPVSLRNTVVASVWTGRDLIVLGQRYGAGRTVSAAYEPRSRGWRELTPPRSADPYPGYRAIWSAKRMIVVNAFRTAIYDPRADRWRQVARGHSGLVAWTGREVIAWGGGCCGDALSDGVAFDPASGAWRVLPRSPLAGSQAPQGAWTGRELLVFVGDRSPDTGKRWPAKLARAAAYDPATNRWRRIAPLPETRRGASMAWDGRELLAVGGRAERVRGPLRADGFAFDPATSRWRRLAAMPSAREGAATAWTGRRLLLWGGSLGGGRETSQTLAYDPAADRWSTLPTAPIHGRVNAFAAWTEHGLMVWGGQTGPNRANLLDGAILRPATP